MGPGARRPYVVPCRSTPRDAMMATTHALAGLALAVPSALVFDGPIRSVLLAMLVASIGYALVRKPLVAVAERLVAAAPNRLLEFVPNRFLPLEDDPVETSESIDPADRERAGN